MKQFKKGDTVVLKEQFYEEPRFKEMDRGSRKLYAGFKSVAFVVSEVGLGEFGAYVRTSKGWLRAELFELVKKPEVTAIWYDECTEYPPKKPVVEVRRKAVNGEWIKITNGCPSHNQDYKNGDIFRAEFDTYGKIHRPENYCIYESEYVVLENYEPADYNPKRRWTMEEIQEAKIIVYDLFFHNPECLKLSLHIGHDGITHAERKGEHFTAKCCPTGEPNEHIGRMVALCKATGRTLPDWIKKEGKTK